MDLQGKADPEFSIGVQIGGPPGRQIQETVFDHFPGGPLPDAFGIAVPPDMGRENLAVALVNPVTDRLPDEVIGNGKPFEAVSFQLGFFGREVIGFVECLLHVEMVAPTGQFQTLLVWMVRS